MGSRVNRMGSKVIGKLLAHSIKAARQSGSPFAGGLLEHDFTTLQPASLSRQCKRELHWTAPGK